MGIEIRGLNALAKGFKERMDLTRIRQVVQDNGAELQQKMMQEAEFSKGYQTGTTKRSISLNIRNGGLTAAVKPGTEYSPYLEYGTRYMEAQPFVHPAFYSQVPIFKADMEKLIK